MDKISIFCGLCGKYIAAVPAKYAGKYTAALCKECRKQYGQSTMELDAREVRQALGARAGELGLRAREEQAGL